MAETPLPPRDAAPGLNDDTASGDALVRNFEATREAGAQSQDADDIAADDAGATALAEKLGDASPQNP